MSTLNALPERPLRFIRNHRLVTLEAPAPDAMLLDWLRAGGEHGTREGCAEGDCGACTVVLGELHQGSLRLRAVNSCIRLLSSIDGCALFTIEDLQAADGALHPAQQAMLECHGSQCGFCTPGFVMSMFALYHQAGAGAQPGCIDRESAQTALSGNLCRCTGYRPILEAAQTMHEHSARPLDEATLTAQLRALQVPEGQRLTSPGGVTWRPADRTQALACRRASPAAQIVAGTTDVGLWINKGHQAPAEVLDLSGVAELAEIRVGGGELHIGAGARLTDAFDAISRRWPPVAGFLGRFAGQPVRNSATLGGNIANGSPIGDSMPLLIALDTRLTLANTRSQREMPLEQFYTGYRRNRLGADELVCDVRIPEPVPGQVVRAYKVSKRFEDDISAVCLALSLRLVDGRILAARIGVGGMAATPCRAPATEAALVDQPWSLAVLQAAGDILRNEFTPISDMRASAGYRREVIGNLLTRLWHDVQDGGVSLAELQP